MGRERGIVINCPLPHCNFCLLVCLVALLLTLYFLFPRSRDIYSKWNKGVIAHSLRHLLACSFACRLFVNMLAFSSLSLLSYSLFPSDSRRKDHLLACLLTLSCSPPSFLTTSHLACCHHWIANWHDFFAHLHGCLSARSLARSLSYRSFHLCDNGLLKLLP